MSLVHVDLCYIAESDPFITGIWGHITPDAAAELEKQLQQNYQQLEEVIKRTSDYDVVTVECFVEYDEGWFIHHVGLVKEEPFPPTKRHHGQGVAS
jgi:hypothetical protein